jgi:hypothetical protein
MDRHYGVREVLAALPLRARTYITGKVLSVWLPLLGIMVIMAIVHMLIGWQIHSGYSLKVMTSFWLGAVLPYMLFGSVVSILWASGQPTRRRAVLIGVLVALAMSGLYLLLIVPFLWNGMLKATSSTLELTSEGFDMLEPYPNALSLEYVAKQLGVYGMIGLSWLLSVWSIKRGQGA